MAIEYDTGTISQPDAGSVGLSMVEKIRDKLVAHAAWELVEEVTPATATVRWYVFRCLATESGLPNNFYVIIGRTLATGELRMAICETYTAGTRVMQHFAPNGSTSSTRAYDANGRYAGTYTLGTVPFSTSNNEPAYKSWVPGGTSTKYWIIVDVDRVMVAFNGASNGFFFAGAFEPLVELAWPMPLMVWGMLGASSGSGILTSNPALASAAAGFQGGLFVEAGGGSTVQVGVTNSQAPALGPAGDLRYNDKLQNNQRAVAEVGIIVSPVAGQADHMTSTGWFCGKQKGMRVGMGGVTPAGFAFGDAYALNGTLWVPYLPTDTRIWNTGVATA